MSSAATLFLIAIDDLRLDRLSFHEDGRDHEDTSDDATPFLSSLARTSVLFEDYVTPSTSSSAALATILTGKLPLEHGLESARVLGRHRLHSRNPTLAGAFRDAGWSTLGWVSSRRFTGRMSGFDRGFERYFDDGLDAAGLPAGMDALLARREGELVPLLETEKPLFLFLQAGELQRDPRSSQQVRSLLERRFRPHVEELPELRNALLADDPFAAIAKLLARRRGSPLWELWRAVSYDAQLLALDAGIARIVGLVERHRKPQLFQWLVVGTRGRYLLEPRPDEPEEGFSEGLLRTPLIAHLGGASGLDSPRRIRGLTSGQRIAPSLTRAFGVGFADEGSADLSAPALAELVVLSPRAGAQARVQLSDDRRGLSIGTPEPYGGSLRVRGAAQRIIVRDPSGSLLAPASSDSVMRVSRDRRKAEWVLSPKRQDTLHLGQSAGAVAIEFPESTAAEWENIFIEGSGSVAGLPIPRLPAPRAEAWNGETPWRVDVVDAGGGWVDVRVAGDSQDVRVFCALYPPAADLTEGLEVMQAAGVDRLTAHSLPGAVCLAGRTGFEARLNLAGRRLAMAVELDGEFVSTDEIRYLGRRFDAGTPVLYLPPWLPQRLDWYLDPVPAEELAAGTSAAPGAPQGTILLGRGLEPSEGPWDLTSEEVRFLQRLKNE